MYIYKIEYTAFAKNNREAPYILLRRLSTISEKNKMQKRVFIYKESMYRHIDTYTYKFVYGLSLERYARKKKKNH